MVWYLQVFFAVIAAVNTCIQFFCMSLSLSSLKWMPRSTFLDLLIVACFGGFVLFLWNSKNFQNGYTTLHLQQQCMNDPAPPHAINVMSHLLASLYFIWAILIGVYVYLIVAWIWISLMINDFGLLFMCLPSVSLQRNIYLCLLFIR